MGIFSFDLHLKFDFIITNNFFKIQFDQLYSYECNVNTDYKSELNRIMAVNNSFSIWIIVNISTSVYIAESIEHQELPVFSK